jgi:hypothetical protein
MLGRVISFLKDKIVVFPKDMMKLRRFSVSFFKILGATFGTILLFNAVVAAQTTPAEEQDILKALAPIMTMSCF